MIGGSLIVGVCLLILGWTSEIVGTLVKNPETVSLLDVSMTDRLVIGT